MAVSVKLALPETLDHVPHVLWERAIISRIEDGGAASRKGHYWANGVADTSDPECGKDIPGLSACQEKFAKSANPGCQNAKFLAPTAKSAAESARCA